MVFYFKLLVFWFLMLYSYAQPHGGEYGIVAVAWLNWQLEGDKQAAHMFVGDDCALAPTKDGPLARTNCLRN